MTREFPASYLSQTLKPPQRVCAYTGALLSEKRNTTVRLDVLYVRHRSFHLFYKNRYYLRVGSYWMLINGRANPSP